MLHPRPPFVPYSLRLLLGRIAREWPAQGRIFDLPAGKFFGRPADLDLSVNVSGIAAATPAGPAAGPHTQLAQNLVLGWLAGGRAFELKTVQVQDQLEIPRPCIDVADFGTNVEWSQELSLDQSLLEYVKAWLLLRILSAWPSLQERLGEPGPHAFELSVGYDLEGVRSRRMRLFIEALRDARPILDELQPTIPEPFAQWRQADLPGRVVASATLSTFHGCPADQIEAIAMHLMSEHDLDVTIKLNPTALGRGEVEKILQRELGYTQTRLVPDAFEQDLSLSQACQLIDRLHRQAGELGRTFGIKLTNTLVVENEAGRLPGEHVYLSGAPLHVLAVALLDRLVEELPATLRTGSRTEGVPVAFSAGIERGNFADAVALGLAPVTVCTDLLKPGGYGRLSAMLQELVRVLGAEGCRDLSAFRARRERAAQEAGHRDAIAAYSLRLRRKEGRRPYARQARQAPRAVEHRLQMWGCTSCNLCVTVCPNDAFLRLRVPAGREEELEGKWQYVCLAELCNACGNCTTFCPEEGEPFRVKPRLYVRRDSFAEESGAAFLVLRADADQPGPFAVQANRPALPEAERLRMIMNEPPGLVLPPDQLLENGQPAAEDETAS
jgi:putative selenate reductase